MTTEGQEFRENRGGILRSNREGRGTTSTYYDELGFAATSDQYSAIQEDEAKFQEGMSSAQGDIDTASTDLDSAVQSAYGELGTPESIANTAWEADKVNWIPVNVYNGEVLENTYMIHRDVANELKTQAFTGAEGSFESHFFMPDGTVADDDYTKANRLNISVTPVGIGSSYGKELNESLVNTVEEYEKTFMTEALNQGTEAYNTGKAQIDDAYKSQWGEINEAQGVLTGYQTTRDAQYAVEQEKFRSNLSALQSLFTNINIG